MIGRTSRWRCAIARSQIIVGIDVGTTKVCALIADVADESPEILGVGICPARGIRKGIVVDIQATVESISASIRRAEQQSGFKAISAFVGIAGAHILSANSHAVVAVHNPDGVVSEDDVARVMESARVIQLPPEQEILHVIPHHYVVDGMDGIREPVGMVGHRLEIEANIITASMTSIHNLMRCIEAANVELDALVLEPLAAGKAVLSPQEREFGALVVDIGGGTTDAAVFHDGAIVHAAILPIGGNHISGDLAVGLRVPFPTAEELKIRHGSTLARAHAAGHTVSVPSVDGERVHTVEQRIVAEIIDARLAETLELVRDEVEQSGYADCYPAGIVLTGGSAQIVGAAELAEEVFGLPARIGVPRGMRGLAEALRGPAFATSVGLLAWGRDEIDGAAAPEGHGALGRVQAVVRSWLRDILRAIVR